jgi:hypothetical protein
MMWQIWIRNEIWDVVEIRFLNQLIGKWHWLILFKHNIKLVKSMSKVITPNN